MSVALYVTSNCSRSVSVNKGSEATDWPGLEMMPASNCWKWPVIRSIVAVSNWSVLYSIDPWNTPSLSIITRPKSNLVTPSTAPSSADNSSDQSISGISTVLGKGEFCNAKLACTSGLSPCRNCSSTPRATSPKSTSWRARDSSTTLCILPSRFEKRESASISQRNTSVLTKNPTTSLSSGRSRPKLMVAIPKSFWFE